MEYEDVIFPSMDGIPLEGWFFPAASNKLVIANHPLWLSRCGFPAHLEPWKQIGEAGGNDLRDFGHSGAANGGITRNGFLEYGEVIVSLQYVLRSETSPPDSW